MKDGKFFRKFMALNVTLLAFLKHLIIFDEGIRRGLKSFLMHLRIVNIMRGFGRLANFKGSSALS